MAHEFAHIVDFKFGTGLSGKHKELFADYLAGCYMYFRSVEFKTTFVQEAHFRFSKKAIIPLIAHNIMEPPINAIIVS
jgi:hypothetical protein